MVSWGVSDIVGAEMSHGEAISAFRSSHDGAGEFARYDSLQMAARAWSLVVGPA